MLFRSFLYCFLGLILGACECYYGCQLKGSLGFCSVWSGLLFLQEAFQSDLARQRVPTQTFESHIQNEIPLQPLSKHGQFG